MLAISGNLVFYGLENSEQKIDGIIHDLNLKELYFELKLIIFEAVSNAFIHGNDRDNNKPISLKWYLKENLLKIHVTDCGKGVSNQTSCNEIDESDILKEGGRGLYIIRNYTDEMYFEGSSIIMKKYI